jgi:hypothetical protein
MTCIRTVHVRRQEYAVTRAARADFRRTNIETSMHAPQCLKEVFATCVREVAMLLLAEWHHAKDMAMNVLDGSIVEVWYPGDAPGVAPADAYDSGGDDGTPSLAYEYSGNVILQEGRFRCRWCTTASGESAPCRFAREYGELLLLLLLLLVAAAAAAAVNVIVRCRRACKHSPTVSHIILVRCTGLPCAHEIKVNGMSFATGDVPQRYHKKYAESTDPTVFLDAPVDIGGIVQTRALPSPTGGRRRPLRPGRNGNWRAELPEPVHLADMNDDDDADTGAAAAAAAVRPPLTTTAAMTNLRQTSHECRSEGLPSTFPSPVYPQR